MFDAPDFNRQSENTKDVKTIISMRDTVVTRQPDLSTLVFAF